MSHRSNRGTRYWSTLIVVVAVLPTVQGAVVLNSSEYVGMNVSNAEVLRANSTGVDVNGNNVYNFFGSNCGSSQAVKRIKADGSYSCTSLDDSDADRTNELQNLSEVLAQGNVANQTIQFQKGIGIGGSNTDAVGTNQIAIGKSAVADDVTGNDDGLVALGESANASDNNAVAIGQTALAAGASSTAIGNSADALTQLSFAGGTNAVAEDVTGSGNSLVALGEQANASDDGATAIGGDALASGTGATALGRSAVASGLRAAAIGNGANATGDRAIAIGYNAQSPAQDEATFGNLNGQMLDVNVTGNVTVHGIGGVTVKNGDLNMQSGRTNNITNFFSTAACSDYVKRIYKNGSYQCGTDTDTDDQGLPDVLAVNNTANETIDFVGSVRIGDDGITADTQKDVAIGVGVDTQSSSTPTVGIGDRAVADSQNTTAIGTVASASATRTTALGAYADAGNSDSIAIGNDAGSTGAETVVIGNDGAANFQSVAIGRKVDAAASYTVAIGYNAYAENGGGVAIGYNANTTVSNAVALGREAVGDGNKALALGYRTDARADRATAVGSDAEATALKALALGRKANATGNRAVAIGYKATAPAADEATFGNLAGETLDVNITGTATAHGGVDVKGDLYLSSVPTPGNDPLCWDGSGRTKVGDCSSLRKYKTNISDLTLGLKTIQQLQPRTFRWIDEKGGQQDLGFVAEEVEQVNPLLADYNGENLTGVKYRQLTAVLANGVQKLANQTQTLKQQKQELQRKNEALEQQIQLQADRIDALTHAVCQTNPSAAVC